MANEKVTEKTVKIKLPLTRSEKKDVYVGLNGKSYLIKRGVEVEVPEGVAEILQRREDILSELFEREEKAKKGLEQR